MGNRLYVGNLSFNTNESAVRALFEGSGRTVVEIKLVSDRDTGQSRGFGFVEMATPSQAEQAIAELNEYEMDGRRLVVNEAQERKNVSRGRR